MPPISRSIPRRWPRAGSGSEDVRTALGYATLDDPKGNLEGEHTAYTLDTNDQLFNAAAFGKVIVAYKNGAPVRVTRRRQRARFDGIAQDRRLVRQQALRAAADPARDRRNTIEIVRQIKAMMPADPRLDPGQRAYRPRLRPPSTTILASVSDVEFTLMLTIGLVVLVIFLFLRNVWATIIPSVTVPLAIVATFA